MNKKISLFALGAALIAVPVLAAPGGAKADTDGNGTLTRTEAYHKRLALALNAQLPAYQNLNGTQPANQLRLMTSVTTAGTACG